VVPEVGAVALSRNARATLRKRSPS
jgi:hypothetical protein